MMWNSEPRNGQRALALCNALMGTEPNGNSRRPTYVNTPLLVMNREPRVTLPSYRQHYPLLSKNKPKDIGQYLSVKRL